MYGANLKPGGPSPTVGIQRSPSARAREIISIRPNLTSWLALLKLQFCPLPEHCPGSGTAHLLTEPCPLDAHSLAKPEADGHSKDSDPTLDLTVSFFILFDF